MDGAALGGGTLCEPLMHVVRHPEEDLLHARKAIGTTPESMSSTSACTWVAHDFRGSTSPTALRRRRRTRLTPIESLSASYVVSGNARRLTVRSPTTASAPASRASELDVRTAVTAAAIPSGEWSPRRSRSTLGCAAVLRARSSPKSVSIVTTSRSCSTARTSAAVSATPDIPSPATVATSWPAEVSRLATRGCTHSSSSSFTR